MDKVAYQGIECKNDAEQESYRTESGDKTNRLNGKGSYSVKSKCEHLFKRVF